MLLVETYIEISEGIGIGLYAKNRILKGTKYWVRNEIFDKIISPSQLLRLNKLAINYIKKYGFLEVSGNWYLPGDNDRFTNHSKSSNTLNHFDNGGLLQYATVTKDIEIGEEILCDYSEICLTCKNGVFFEPMT